MKLRIGWHTEGRGPRNEGSVLDESRTAESGDLPRVPGTWEFEVHLPLTPLSDPGYLFQIVWTASVTVALATDGIGKARPIQTTTLFRFGEVAPARPVASTVGR